MLISAARVGPKTDFLTGLTKIKIKYTILKIGKNLKNLKGGVK